MKQEFLKNTLSVDCGIHTACAYWSGTNKPETEYFTCPQYKLKDHYKYRSDLSFGFKEILMHYFPQRKGTVYLEGTQKYKNVVGQIAIDKGTIFELAYLVGRYEECCCQQGLDCKIINASQWKGQMTKEMTAMKIKMINGCTYENDHITDSVGLGFGIIGAFEWEIRKR